MRNLLKSIEKIGNIAVQKAQKESHELGIANVYAKRGKLYFENADGTITTTPPMSYKLSKRKRHQKRSQQKPAESRVAVKKSNIFTPA